MEQLLFVATAISAKCDYRGMASIKAVYNPYEALWVVSASWSDASEIKAVNDRLALAINELTRLLDDELRKCERELKCSS